MVGIWGDGGMLVVQCRYAVASLVLPFSLYSFWGPVVETLQLKIWRREQVEYND